MLQSAGLAASPVDLRLDAAGVEPSPPPLGSPESLAHAAQVAAEAAAAAAAAAGPSPGAAAAAAAKPAAAKVKVSVMGGKPPPAAAAASAAAASAAAASGAAAADGSDAVQLAVDIEAVLDACKQETEAVAKAYYAAKVRRGTRARTLT